MSRSKKPTTESPELPSPIPLRPQTLRRGISLTFDVILAAFPARRLTPQPGQIRRSKTAPASEREDGLQSFSSIGLSLHSEQTPAPKAHIPLLSVPEEPCPHDPSTYRSFPSIERPRCTFCGMRPPKSRSSTPCHDWRSRSPLSHMKFILQRRSDIEVNLSVTTESFSPLTRHNSSSFEQGPHRVPPDIAAKRIGNPPRRASLPMCQISAINTPIGPSSADSASQSTRQSSATPDTHVPRPKSALVTQDVRPTSPKLHHIHGLPNSKAYPFIYKREVSRHLTALHAGSPSPLADFAHAAQARTSVDVTTDYSETVYYGSRILPAFSPTPDQRLSPQRSLSNVVVEQTANSSEQDLTPRLRGGGEEERAHNPSCGLTLKQLLLTCHKAGRRHTTNPNSDETITPTRIPDAVQIAQAIRKTQGTARLPRNLLKKNSPQATQRTTQLELPREDAPTILPTHKTRAQTSRVRRHTRSLHTLPFPCNIFAILAFIPQPPQPTPHFFSNTNTKTDPSSPPSEAAHHPSPAFQITIPSPPISSGSQAAEEPP